MAMQLYPSVPAVEACPCVVTQGTRDCADKYQKVLMFRFKNAMT